MCRDELNQEYSKSLSEVCMDKHFFFDGYSIDNNILGNKEIFTNFMQEINTKLFSGKGQLKIIDYFNGVSINGGISGVILTDYAHLTAHTFSCKETVFIDCFGMELCREQLFDIIMKYFHTENFDLCLNNDKKGKFGRHVIITTSEGQLKFNEALNLMKEIVKSIKMTPISDVVINYIDNTYYDIIQPIAESHVSIHRDNNEISIDVFSCKYYDIANVLSLLNDKDVYKVKSVQRGINFEDSI